MKQTIDYRPDSLSQVQTPSWVKSSAAWIIIVSFLSLIGLGFIPWQQTVIGSGRVTSFSPNNRPQQIESPIKASIKKWHVKEGSHVKEGQILVELQDLQSDFLSPDMLDLTQGSINSLRSSQSSYANKAQALQASIANLNANRQDSLARGRQNINIAKVDLQTAKLNLERLNKLSEKGLVSQREWELARQKERQANAKLQQAQIELDRINTKALSDISKMEADRASSLAEAAKLQDSERKAQLKLSLAKRRKEIAQIRAPYDGIIVSLFKRGIGETFKENEPIAVITPETKDQAVEIFIDDLDAPLVYVGAHVRLQFSGWPALQFAGFSEAIKVGTFAGRVAVVDNVHSSNNKYRVLVVPEKHGDWPLGKYLRPGTRAAGWIILKTVPLGYELWRRFNGFPIAFADVQNSPELPSNSKSSSDNKKQSSFIFKRK